MQKTFEKQLIDFVKSAFEAHSKGKDFGDGIRFTMVEGEPEWKLLVSWRATAPAPTITVKQRK